MNMKPCDLCGKTEYFVKLFDKENLKQEENA